MYHLRKFANNNAYREYLDGNDGWRPLVAYVVNGHTEDISTDWGGKDKNMEADDWSTTPETSLNTPGVAKHSLLPRGGDDQRWVDYHDLGEHWIEVFNNGTMYFNTMNTSLGLFDASVDSSGNLNITVPPDSSTRNSSAWYTYENGVLNFWNWPEDYLDD